MEIRNPQEIAMLLRVNMRAGIPKNMVLMADAADALEILEEDNQNLLSENDAARFEVNMLRSYKAYVMDSINREEDFNEWRGGYPFDE